jgi:hypothetical protein
MERCARKAMAPFFGSGSSAPSCLGPQTNQVLDSNQDSKANDKSLDQDADQPDKEEEKTHFYYVNPARQEDPLPNKPSPPKKTFISITTFPLAPVSFPLAIRLPFARLDGSPSSPCHLTSLTVGKNLYFISWNAAIMSVRLRRTVLKLTEQCGPMDGGRAPILINPWGVFAALER